MTLATSNRSRIRYIKESAFGVIPTSGSVRSLRFTGESLGFTFQTTTSKEIRSDRQTTDLTQTGASATGSINFELSYGEYDPLFEAFLQNTWSVFGTGGLGPVGLSEVASVGTFTTSTLTAATATSGAGIFTNLVKGQWVKITGSSISANNKIVQVSRTVSPTSTVITFEGTPFTAGAGGSAIQISSSRLINGTSESSWTIERGLEDVSQFFAYRGMSADKLNLKFASGTITEGSLEFMGRDSTRGNATQLTGTLVPSLSYDVQNAVSGVGDVREGGSTLTGTFIKSVDLNLSNNLRARDAIGVLGAASVGSGSISVTGTLEVYLADGSMYQKFIDNVASSLSLYTVDGAGNGYVIELPKLKYSDAKVNNGGLNTDVMLSMPFTALVDPVLGYTISLCRVGTALV